MVELTRFDWMEEEGEGRIKNDFQWVGGWLRKQLVVRERRESGVKGRETGLAAGERHVDHKLC